MSKPNSVRYAVYVMLASLIVNFIYLSINAKASYDYSISRGLSNLDSFAILVFSLVIAITPSSILIYFINIRHNWARIAYALFYIVATIVVIYSGTQTFSNQSAVAILFSIFHHICHISAIALLFSRPSNFWFRKT